MKIDQEILIIGGGNMGYSIAKGILKNKIIPSNNLIIIDPNADDLGLNELECRIYKSSKEIKSAQLAIFATKPFIAEKIFQEYSSHKIKYVASIMAGIPIKLISNYFPNTPIARIMPNTPCLLGKGSISYTVNKKDSIFEKIIEKIFSSLGIIIRLDSEKLIDLTTAISGSGPGFIYLFAKYFIEFAIENEIDRKEAELIVKHTFLGAGEMLTNNFNKTIDQLISDVRTPGGTTEAGLESFQKLNIDKIINSSLMESYLRAVEIGKLAIRKLDQ